MSETKTKSNWRPDELKIGTGFHEPAWAIEQRRIAAEKFEDAVMPLRIDEPWRRTDISPVKFDRFLTGWETFPNAESVESLTPHDGFLRVHSGQGTQQANDGLMLSDARATTAIAGLHALPIEDAILRAPKIAESYLAPELPDGLHLSLRKFAYAVYAFRNAGSLISVAPNTKIEIPIGVITSLFSEPAALYTQNVIHVGKNASLTISEEFLSPPDKRTMLSLAMTRIVLEEGARLDMTALQNWGNGVYHYGMHWITLKRDAQLEMVWGGIGGRIAKSRIIIELAGEGARARIGGFVAGGGKQLLDHDTTQRHIARNTFSDLLFKGVVNNRARSVYQGMIVVEREAQKSDAYQSVKHLIMSDGAHVDALPGLEILADDVRCTHGATTAPVDENSVQYMACRGMSRRVAEELLIEAHVEPIIARIANTELQQRCREAVTEKLLGHKLEL